MPRTDDPILRFERHLQEAIHRFADGLRRHIGGALPFGLRSGDGADRLAALMAEEGRLRRKARRNAPCYDLNRHIAVRRMIATCAVASRPVRGEADVLRR